MPTDTSEKGLETLIVAAMTGLQPAAPASGTGAKEAAAAYSIPGWIPGDPHDYDRAHALDLVQIRSFLFDTQPQVAAAGSTDINRALLEALAGAEADRPTAIVLFH